MPVASSKIVTSDWSKHAKRLRGIAMLRYAEEFHNAASKAGSILVRAYLLGHALELYLKGFLLRAGKGESELKDKYGHNLVKLAADAEKLGLSSAARISAMAKEDLKALNKPYMTKSLEYFSLLHLLVPPALPKLDRLFRFAKAMRTHERKVVSA